MPPTLKRRWFSVLHVRGHGKLILGLVALPLIVFLAYSLNLFNIGGISNAVEQRYISFVARTTQKTLSNDIRLIYIDKEQTKDLLELQLLRGLHAQLISKLAKAGAAVVAFDFTFPPANDASSKANKAFAD